MGVRCDRGTLRRVNVSKKKAKDADNNCSRVKCSMLAYAQSFTDSRRMPALLAPIVRCGKGAITRGRLNKLAGACLSATRPKLPTNAVMALGPRLPGKTASAKG